MCDTFPESDEDLIKFLEKRPHAAQAVMAGALMEIEQHLKRIEQHLRK